MRPRCWPQRLREAWTVRDAALWVGLLAAPAAWLGDLGLRYVAAVSACPDRHPGLPFLLTTTALACAIAGGIVAGCSWIRAPAAAAEEGSPAARSRFMAGAGLLTSAVFALAILVQSIPTLVLAPCE
jgi:hypothetical protein